MTPEQPSMLPPLKVKHLRRRLNHDIDLHSPPLLRIPDVSAAHRTRGGRALPPGCVQSEPGTQRQVSPPLLGRGSDLNVDSSAVVLVTDGATRRWVKRCASATTMWLTSCARTRTRAPPRPPLLTTEGRAWTPSPDSRTTTSEIQSVQRY